MKRLILKLSWFFLIYIFLISTFLILTLFNLYKGKDQLLFYYKKILFDLILSPLRLFLFIFFIHFYFFYRIIVLPFFVINVFLFIKTFFSKKDVLPFDCGMHRFPNLKNVIFHLLWNNPRFAAYNFCYTVFKRFWQKQKEPGLFVLIKNYATTYVLGFPIWNLEMAYNFACFFYQWFYNSNDCNLDSLLNQIYLFCEVYCSENRLAYSERRVFFKNNNWIFNPNSPIKNSSTKKIFQTIKNFNQLREKSDVKLIAHSDDNKNHLGIYTGDPSTSFILTSHPRPEYTCLRVPHFNNFLILNLWTNPRAGVLYEDWLHGFDLNSCTKNTLVSNSVVEKTLRCSPLFNHLVQHDHRVSFFLIAQNFRIFGKVGLFCQGITDSNGNNKPLSFEGDYFKCIVENYHLISNESATLVPVAVLKEAEKIALILDKMPKHNRGFLEEFTKSVQVKPTYDEGVLVKASLTPQTPLDSLVISEVMPINLNKINDENIEDVLAEVGKMIESNFSGYSCIEKRNCELKLIDVINNND